MKTHSYLLILAAALLLSHGHSIAQEAPMTLAGVKAEAAAEEARKAQTSATADLRRIQALWEGASDIERETKALAAFSAPPDIGSERARMYVTSAQRAWSGMKQATDLALEAREAVAPAAGSAERLSRLASQSVSSGAAKEQLDTPEIKQLWRVREAEAKLRAARLQRLTQLAEATSYEATVLKEKVRHQTLLEEVQVASLQQASTKAREADRAAASIAAAAAQASIAYSEVARLAAIELSQARVMLEAQIDIARDSIGWVDLVKSRR